MINKVTSTSLQGFQKASSAFSKRAGEIASPANRRPGNLARTLVELKQHEHAAKANVKTLEAGDKALGTLLDVKA